MLFSYRIERTSCLINLIGAAIRLHANRFRPFGQRLEIRGQLLASHHTFSELLKYFGQWDILDTEFRQNSGEGFSVNPSTRRGGMQAGRCTVQHRCICHTYCYATECSLCTSNTGFGQIAPLVTVRARGRFP